MHEKPVKSTKNLCRFLCLLGRHGKGLGGSFDG